MEMDYVERDIAGAGAFGASVQYRVSYSHFYMGICDRNRDMAWMDAMQSDTRFMRMFGKMNDLAPAHLLKMSRGL